MTFQHYFERLRLQRPDLPVALARDLLVEALQAISLDAGVPRAAVTVDDGDGLYALPSEGRHVLTPPRDARLSYAVFALYAEGDEDPTDPGETLDGPRLYVTATPEDTHTGDPTPFVVVVECYPPEVPDVDSDDLGAFEVPFGEGPLLRALAELTPDPFTRKNYWDRFRMALLRLKVEARDAVTGTRMDGVARPDFSATPDTDY